MKVYGPLIVLLVTTFTGVAKPFETMFYFEPKRATNKILDDANHRELYRDKAVLGQGAR